MNNRISKLAAAVKNNPDDSFSKFALALELKKNGFPEKTRVLFEDIRTNDPGYVGVYYHLGKLYYENDQNKKAQQVYKEGIEIAEQAGDQHAKKELSAALIELEFELES